MSGLERKNGWQSAEFAGENRHGTCNIFCGRSSWHADEVGEDLRRYGAECLGTDDGVLIVDETVLPKKETKSAGSRDNSQARADGSRIVRSACSSLSVRGTAMRLWIEPCTCRRRGSTIRRVVEQP